MFGPATQRIRLLLTIGASASVAAAVTLDVLTDEHPTHTLSLGLMTVVVAGVGLRARGRRGGILQIVAGALVAQPALHLASKLGGGHRFHVENEYMHPVVEDGPATAMQVVVTAAIVIAVALAARAVDVLVGVVCRPAPLLVPAPPSCVRTVRGAVDSFREGSMLRWCGWTIRAARRGPPPAPNVSFLPSFRPDPS